MKGPEIMLELNQLPQMNEVAGFNPADFTRELTNEDGTKCLYLDVKYRLLWFRLHCPNGKVDPQIIHADGKSAVVTCRLYADRNDPEDHFLSKATAQRFASADKYGDRFLEIAETAAIGRALAEAGYGTQFCSTKDMLDQIVVDAPIEVEKPEAVEETVTEDPPIIAIQESASPTIVRKTLDDYLNTMTLEEAESVVIDIGLYSGQTLGEIAIKKPKDLEWYIKYYSGKNLALKAGATLLVRAAMQKAG